MQAHYRGGVGVRRTYRVLAEEALLQMRTDRVCFAPYGLMADGQGGRSRNFMEIGNERKQLPGKVTMPVPNDTVIIHGQAGAAVSATRCPARPADVHEDVLDGKISPAYARARHGVVIGARGTVDLAATARLRAERAEGRRM